MSDTKQQCRLQYPGIVFLLLWLPVTALSGNTTHGKDISTGRETWSTTVNGVSLKLTQILPDQVRGFYLARGFPVSAVEHINKTCVFQTILRNQSAPSAIDYNLVNWYATSGGNKTPLKLQEKWQEEWEQDNISASARTAFRWALLPTVQHYEIGDWNMGMLTVPLSLGSHLDLHFNWRTLNNNKLEQATLEGVRCATDNALVTDTRK